MASSELSVLFRRTGVPSFDTFVKVEGLQEFEAQLKRLREEFGIKTGGIIMRGVTAGARVVQRRAKQLAPPADPSGFTRFRIQKLKAQAAGKSFRGRKLKRRGTALIRYNLVAHRIPVKAPLAEGKPTAIVRVRNRGWDTVRTRRKPGGAMRFRQIDSSPGYWWLIEFGRSGHPFANYKHRGFMRRAAQQSKGAALAALRDTVRKEIDKTWAKHTGASG
jgi:hypothetical protein